MVALAKGLIESPSVRYAAIKWTGKVKNLIMGICISIILVGVCYIILSPIIGILSRAFMDPADLTNPLIFLIPQNFTIGHVTLAITAMGYWSSLLATLAYAVGFSVLNVLIASMVGYGFARFKFPGSEILFALVIVTIVVPVQAYMIPMFLNFRFFLGTNTSLIGSPLSMGLLTAGGVGLRTGLYIYIFRQFFRGLPKEIEEAAFIDGAGPLATYIRVMIPNAVPAIVTVVLFSFVWHYNDTFYSSLLITGNNFMSTRVMAVGPAAAALITGHDPLRVQMVVFASVLLAITPILTIYLFLQRLFVEGLERSGIVG